MFCIKSGLKLICINSFTMDYYYITGTSRGIGKAIANLLLEDSNNFVTGISRTSSIKHSNYTHLSIDLNDLAAVNQISFNTDKNISSVTLINNAGVLGSVKHAGNIDTKDIIMAYNINVVAPSILMNNFIKKHKSINKPKTIINISSGAGKRPIDGWSTYCSSKAALDMFSRVVAQEQKLESSMLRIYSIAPGIVDTFMQEQIREADIAEFSRLDEFIKYKKSSLLISPEEVAKKLLAIIRNDKDILDPVFSLS